MNLTEVFTDTLFTLKNRPLPDEIVLEARKCLMDETGTMLAGAALQKDLLTRYLDCFTGEDATVVGLGRKASLQNAALANGISGHSYDFDDGHRFSTVHLGSTVIPPVLAVAEKEGRSMDEVLHAIVLGYETSIRLGHCVQPGHRARGFHSSGTVGTVGAAVAVATLLDFDRPMFKDALSAGLTSAAGVNEMILDISTMKPYNVGRAAHDGITAAYIAQAGFHGPYDALTGNFSFLRGAWCEDYDASVLTLEADDGFNITGGYHKPYASCRHTHGAVYAAFKAAKAGNVRWQDIASVRIVMYGQGIKGHDHTDVPSPGAAKMSTPFCIALALKTGRVGISSFTEETTKDADILDLSKRITIVADEEMSSWVPKKRASRVEITTKSGETFSYQADYAPGEPELPMTIDDYRDKMTELAFSAGKTQAEVDRLTDMILHFRGAAADFIALLA